MSSTCLVCGGTLITAFGEPCPNCSKKALNELPIYMEIPAQYQGIKFDKSFLPSEMQKHYGEYMESLLKEITLSASTYQKNLLICAPPNCGKSVWSYNVYARVTSAGIKMPPIRDVIEARQLLNGFGDKEEGALFSTAKLAIVRLPRDLQAWMLDTVGYIVERRVRSNGCTIFIYSGTEEDIKQIDRTNKLRAIKGTGSFNTIFVKSFKENYYGNY